VERRELVAVEQFLCTRVVGVLSASPSPAPPDLIARPLKDLPVRRVLPLDPVIDDLEETLPFLLL